MFWYKKAIEQGNANAEYNLGMMYADDGDGKQALYWIKKAAESGHPEAQYAVGLFYVNGVSVGNGTDVTRDTKQAVYWLKKAANQGHILAQEHLQKMQ